MNGIQEYITRDMIKWLRSPVSVVSMLAMPAAWLIFVGLALPVTFTGNYLDFIVPGILVMTMLSSSLNGGTLLMFDKILGFLNKFLALPTPRESILFGKILFITIRGAIQATIILVIGILIGATILPPAQYGMIYLILLLFGFLMSACATTIALYLGDHDSYSAFNTMISMPLFFTSSALMPYDVMPGWLSTIAHFNPLSYAIDAVRAAETGTIPFIQIGLLALLGAIVIAICMQMFRRVTV